MVAKMLKGDAVQLNNFSVVRFKYDLGRGGGNCCTLHTGVECGLCNFAMGVEKYTVLQRYSVHTP
jgi:hypothetical protein